MRNVLLIPRQPKSVICKIWSLCDVSLIHLKNESVFKKVIPSKIFESMGMGLPILMAVVEGEATRIVRDAQCGIVVEPENAQSLVDGVLEMYTDSVQFELFKKKSFQSAVRCSREIKSKEMLDVISSSLKED